MESNRLEASFSCVLMVLIRFSFLSLLYLVPINQCLVIKDLRVKKKFTEMKCWRQNCRFKNVGFVCRGELKACSQEMAKLMARHQGSKKKNSNFEVFDSGNTNVSQLSRGIHNFLPRATKIGQLYARSIETYTLNHLQLKWFYHLS